MTYDARGQLGPEEIKSLVEKSLDADKAINITTIDLSEHSPLADYMIVASGTSSRHVGALAQKLREKLEISGIKDIRIEGMATSDWVVLDAGDVIVHIFRPEVRSFYNIEKMWGPYAGLDVVVQQVTA